MKINLIIERLFKYFNVKTNTELAFKLGVTPTALSNWKARGSMDYDLIFTKCEGVNFHWLFTGEGDMLINVPFDVPFNVPLNQTYKNNAAEPSVGYNPKPCQHCRDKDIQIQELTKELKETNKRIHQLIDKLTTPAQNINTDKDEDTGEQKRKAS